MSDETQDTIYSRTPSPEYEPEGLLCFNFKKRPTNKTITPKVLRKSNTVKEKNPHSVSTQPPSQGLSFQSPLAPPIQVRVSRRQSQTLSTISSGYQYSDSTNTSTVTERTQLPDVVASYPIQRNYRINSQAIHISASERKHVKTITNQNDKNAKAETDNRHNLQQLEAENQRLKDILKTNSIPLDHEINEKSNKIMKAPMRISDSRQEDKEEHVLSKDQKAKNHKNGVHFNTMQDVRKPAKSSPNIIKSRNVETSATKVKTTNRSDIRLHERDKQTECCPMPQSSIKKKTQLSAPTTPVRSRRRMSSSASSGSMPHLPHKLADTKHPAGAMMAGYVFLGSGGQVLAECKGHSSQVIVKTVRSSVAELLDPGLETVSHTSSYSDEEFDEDKIFALQQLREISRRMEKEENKNSFTEMSIYPCNLSGQMVGKGSNRQEPK